MRTSRRWLTVIAAAGGLLIAGLPAIPAQATPGTFHICLENAQSYCLQSNGPGNQVTITNSGSYANWHQARTSGGEWQDENGSGNCLRAGDNNVVKIENGPCLATNLADWWYAPGNYPYRQESSRYSDDMLVHGTVNGYKVWHAKPVSGDWSNWVVVPS
jgi:hypothetical protein